MIVRPFLFLVLALSLAACSKSDDRHTGSTKLASLAAQLSAHGEDGDGVVDSTHAKPVVSTEATAREELLTAYAAAVRASKGLTPPARKPERASVPTPKPVKVQVPSTVVPDKPPVAHEETAPDDERAIRELYLTAYQATFRSAGEAAEQRLEELKRRMDAHRVFVRQWSKKHPEQGATPERSSEPSTTFPAPQRPIAREGR